MNYNLFSLKIKGLVVCLTLLTVLAICTSPASAKTLTINSKGAEVTFVQQSLKDMGYNIKKVTGVFDNSTKRAVLAFQRDNKIKLSGMVDEKTMEAIKTLKKGAKQPEIKIEPPKSKPATPNSTPSVVKPRVVPESNPFLPRGKVKGIIATAKRQIGVPYVSGGTTPKGFDCSGYVQYVFAQNGLSIPRTADVQYELGKKSTISAIEAGDLVFFHTDSSSYVTHCGIYLGKGQFIHASSSKGVRIDELSNDYWKKAFVAAKHIVK